MAISKQRPLLERLARRPLTLEGGVRLDIELKDERHAVLRLKLGDNEAAVRAAFLSLPFPSGLERLLAQEPDVEAVVVDRAPPGLRKLAQERGIGYLDSHGAGRIVAPGFVYVVAPRPGLGALLPGRSSPFAPKASRVVRALLSEPKHQWRVSELADRVHLNPGNVHRSLASLLESGFLERENEAYLVADPGSLIEAWAEALAVPRERISVPVREGLVEDVRGLVASLDGYAVVSGELAAELEAPYLPAESAIVHCLDPAAWDSLAHNDGSPLLRPLTSRPGQILVDLPDEGVAHFGVSMESLDLVNPVQAYVDLYRDRGRGRDAAEHLRRSRLHF